jgi:hypothetical protein
MIPSTFQAMFYSRTRCWWCCGLGNAMAEFSRRHTVEGTQDEMQSRSPLENHLIAIAKLTDERRNSAKEKLVPS